MQSPNYNQLISSIASVHESLQSYANNAVNQALTLRNWIIGYYIVEFEQNGEYRASYGKNLLSNLAESISIRGLTAPELSRCRQFYNTYPQILGTLTQEFNNLLPNKILGTLPQESKLTDENKKYNNLVPAKMIVKNLSYSHITELIKIDDKLKRTFYEMECIKGIWSVRELKRQIDSQFYERSGLSKKPELLTEIVSKKSEQLKAKDIIKNIYTFEFLEIPTQSILEESEFETSILNHLQQFILELGNGFCFEARQKRILIGEAYYFIDLLFYHRILKCHVLVELKIGEFKPGDIGQLNTYLSYFKKNIVEETDNPPVGMLLVAEKDQALVEYATAGMDQNLFVQQYMLELPETEKIRKYLEKELEKFGK